MKIVFLILFTLTLTGCVIREQCVQPVQPKPQPESVQTGSAYHLDLQSNGLTAEQNDLLKKMNKDMADEAAKSKQ